MENLYDLRIGDANVSAYRTEPDNQTRVRISPPAYAMVLTRRDRGTRTEPEGESKFLVDVGNVTMEITMRQVRELLTGLLGNRIEPLYPSMGVSHLATLAHVTRALEESMEISAGKV